MAPIRRSSNSEASCAPAVGVGSIPVPSPPRPGPKPAPERGARRTAIPLLRAKSALRLSESAQDGLDGMAADKATFRDLLDARPKLVTAVRSGGLGADAVFSALHETGTLGNIDLAARHVQAKFNDGQPLLARTLTRGTKDDAFAAGGDIPISCTPGKVERNTLNNRRQGLDILITPSTLIDKDLNVSTISSHPERPRWSRMPSVLHAAPTAQGRETVGVVDVFRKSFGNSLSFASNQGFTPGFAEKVGSGRYSHGELIDEFSAQAVIVDNVKTQAPFDTLPRSLPAIKQQVAAFQAAEAALRATGSANRLYADGSVPHNEVVARLWLWDTSAVDVGQDMKEGLAAAMELQMARKALRKELDLRGIGHPMFVQFLMQQLSVGPEESSLTRSETQARFEALSTSDREVVLEALQAKLDSPVSLCRYSPCDSSIRGIAASEVSGPDVLDALDGVLAARLGQHSIDEHPIGSRAA